MLTWLTRVRAARSERFVGALRRRHPLLHRPKPGQLILEAVGAVRRQLTLLPSSPRFRDAESFGLRLPSQANLPGELFRIRLGPLPTVVARPRATPPAADAPAGPVESTAPIPIELRSPDAIVPTSAPPAETTGESVEIPAVAESPIEATGTEGLGAEAPEEPLLESPAPLAAARPAETWPVAAPPTVAAEATPHSAELAAGLPSEPVVPAAPAVPGLETRPTAHAEPISAAEPSSPAGATAGPAAPVEPLTTTPRPSAASDQPVHPGPAIPEPARSPVPPVRADLPTRPVPPAIARPIDAAAAPPAPRPPLAPAPPPQPSQPPQPVREAEPPAASGTAPTPIGAAPGLPDESTEAAPATPEVAEAAQPEFVATPPAAMEPPVARPSETTTSAEGTGAPRSESPTPETAAPADVSARSLAQQATPPTADSRAAAQPPLRPAPEVGLPHGAPPASSFTPIEERRARPPAHRREPEPPAASPEPSAAEPTREPSGQLEAPAAAATTAAPLPVEPEKSEPETPLEWLARLQRAFGPKEARPAATPRPAGEPLSMATRATIEPILGTEAGTARVHRGPTAAAAAARLGAEALAVGDQIVLGAGQQESDPKTVGVLGHEMLHVARRRNPRFVPAVATPRPSELGGQAQAPARRVPAVPGAIARTPSSTADEEGMALVVEAAAAAAARERQRQTPRAVSWPAPRPPSETTAGGPSAPPSPAPETPRPWGSLPAPWEPIPEIEEPAAAPPASLQTSETSGGAPAVHRAGEERSVPPTGPEPGPGQPPERASGAPPAGPDIDQLARQVYQVLKRRLANERRRFS